MLNETEYLDELLKKFIEIGIPGGTVIDSEGMGNALVCQNKIPIVGGVRQLFEHCKEGNKTIFSIVDSEEKLSQATELLEGKLIDLNEPGVGIAFYYKIDNVIGLS
ncbi:hypothetical protein [Natranaerobius thermophilus]|uniref:Nitrogen regulatory protein P-II n=1 Tax=Natranaerobius thermophilus (strain ATCC BAA-1301 / DSM 18059 / JW/NM-WN-LF) TaxID=457570 RepID=B2A4V3_NATTJ|nr:hypothetical protein [Natranaerobius thermophilus]ACB83875.1 conserved hypothetical protein [Natranaerobius thermophilus JW/NM-WN-LF]